MSSAPPNPPYPPPYDPKAQWRVYREQQKAAFRARREAWRAQRRGWYGAPRVPSIVGPLILIAIGVVWLLIYSGKLPAAAFWNWYAHWWPLVLIAAGLALLGEWMLDMRRQTPVYRRGNVVGIVVLVGFLGLVATVVNHAGPPFRNWNWNGNGGDFFNMFGLPEHDADQAPIHQAIPAGAMVEIENPRGDVSVSTGDAAAVDVQAQQVAFAKSDAEAARIFEAEKATVSVTGSTVLIRAGSQEHGRMNLSVVVPASAQVTVNAGRGDVTASGLNGIELNAARGDVHLNAIRGAVVARLSRHRGDFAAHQVAGDVTINGNCGDLTLSAIKGRVTVNGDLFGTAHFENLGGPLSVRTSVTQIEVASLPGDLTLDSDDLHVNEATGTVRVTTHAKDVDLNQIYGDSYVENRDGTISVEPAGAYGIEARNRKGDVEITLPPNAAGTVSGRTHNGDVVSDFALAISGDQDKTVNGRIGNGGPRIELSTDIGDLHIKKGPAFPATPPPPAVESGITPPVPPQPPVPPHARHLHSLKPLPPQPVTE